MFSRLLQFSGLIMIALFSAVCIFLSLMERELTLGSFLKEVSQRANFFESRFYDIRMKYTMEKESFDDRLVLAAIDDASISKVGTWPFPRTIWTEFMNKMNTYGASVVAFDVFFSENALSYAGDSPDEGFAESIKNFQENPNQKVILPYALASETDAFEEVPEVMYKFIMATSQQGGNNLIPNKIGRRVFPIPLLQETGAGLGIIQVHLDSDGIFRHYPVLANVDGLYFPSYSLLAYEYFTGDRATFEMNTISDPKIKVSTGKLSLNILGETKVRWSGGMNHFPLVGIHDIISASDDDEQMNKTFRNKIVYVGSTAFGAHDLRHTPIDAMLPGVYFHMNMTQMLLDGNFFKPVSTSTQYSLYMLSGGTFLIILFMLFRNPIVDLFAVVFITAGLLSLDIFYLVPQGYEIKLFFCLFSVVACYSWSTFLSILKR